MTTVVVTRGKLFRDALKEQKVKIVGLTAGAGLLVNLAAAVDLNGTIGPLIDGVTEMIPSLMALVLALIPLMIAVAVAKFFPQLFDSILGWMRM